MKKIAISQPRYLPAANYIERILISDVFILLDNVQFSKRDFEHRNRIRTPEGVTWLSIPIDRKNSVSSAIVDSRIIADDSWKASHLRSFKLFYKKTPFYEEIIPLLEQIYSSDYLYLNDVVRHMLDVLMTYFNVRPEFYWASNYLWSSSNDDLLIEITKYFGGTAYISGPNGRDYIDEVKFKEANIKLLYHEYNHPSYKQVWGDFHSYMTIWDMMFYFGRDTLTLLRNGKLIESDYQLRGKLLDKK